jgi:hypothetical protein
MSIAILSVHSDHSFFDSRAAATTLEGALLAGRSDANGPSQPIREIREIRVS